MMLRKHTLLLLLFSGLLMMGCGDKPSESNTSDEGNTRTEKPSNQDIIQGMTVAEFNEMTAADPLVMVDFHATWCGPCKAMAPALKKVEEDHAGKIKVVKIDIDHNQALASHFKIDGIPYIKTFSNGKLVNEVKGQQSEQQLLAILDPYLQQ